MQVCADSWVCFFGCEQTQVVKLKSCTKVQIRFFPILINFILPLCYIPEENIVLFTTFVSQLYLHVTGQIWWFGIQIFTDSVRVSVWAGGTSQHIKNIFKSFGEIAEKCAMLRTGPIFKLMRSYLHQCCIVVD